MLMSQFWSELAKTRHNYNWEEKRGILRCKSKRTKNNNCEYCPITAVYKRLTRKNLNDIDFLKAAKELGLRPNRARAIADAADGIRNYYNQKIRKVLKLQPTTDRV